MNFANHHGYFYGRETVDLLRKTSASADDTADSIASALHEDIFVKDAGGAMIVTTEECKFHLPTANITTDPRQGDVIRRGASFGSSRHVIQTATKFDMIGQWECFCTREKKTA